MRRLRRVLSLTLLCAVSSVCGPELTEPGEGNVSGTWFATGPAAGLTDVTIQISQKEDGAITGNYTATGSPGSQFCPPNPPCSISGPVAGSNTVLQVFFELEHAGKFTGQAIDESTLRGSMERDTRVDPIEFTLVAN